jgi:hypothetical protein
MALVHNIHRSELVAVMDDEDLAELRRSSNHRILPVFVESPFRDICVGVSGIRRGSRSKRFITNQESEN